MIIVIDNEDRKNEDDLAMAVDMITPEAINFTATHGNGLSCLAMSGAEQQWARRHGLHCSCEE
jgi:3,4-dihydroxy-2-butanone 4-phosphate synthase